MNATPQITEPAEDAVPAVPGITILYEDRATGLHAKGFSDRLVTSLGGTESVAPACWRCELTDLPLVAAAMARDARASEFVILSLRGDTDLTVALKRWLESWLVGAVGGPSVLIALFDAERCSTRHAKSILHYLRHVTALAEVAFFSHRAETAHETGSLPSEAGERTAARRKVTDRSRRPTGIFLMAPLAA